MASALSSVLDVYVCVSFSYCSSRCNLSEMFYFCYQHKLKSSQRDKVRQFIAFTQTGEKTAINCLSAHDWKLDVAVDNYYQNPDRYNSEPRMSVDRRKLETLWHRYKGMLCRFSSSSFSWLDVCDLELAPCS